MSPDDILNQLNALQPNAKRRLAGLQSLLQRSGPLPPPLLELAARLPDLPGLADGAEQLQAALPALVDLRPLLTASGQLQAWAEPPADQVQRVVSAVLAGVRGQPVANAAARAAAEAQAHALQFGLTPLRAKHAGRAAAISMHWLAEAAAAGADAAVPYGAWGPSDAQEQCLLPLALLDGQGQGILGWLSLWRVPHPGAGLCLAPAPASTLLLRAATWDTALAQVNERLQQLVAASAGSPPAACDGRHPVHDTAIAWDVALPTGQRLGTLQGNSASAALLLGAAWLMRRVAEPRWRAKLLRLMASDLRNTVCTAALDEGEGTRLVPVGGGLEKAEGLQRLARLLGSEHRVPPLVLHVSRGQVQPTMTPQGVPMESHDTLLALLDDVVDAADRLTDEQIALLDMLRQRDADAEGPLPPLGDDHDGDAGATDSAASVDAWQATLEKVHGQTAARLRTWLLRCWAEWERDLGGRVQQRHVLLQVEPNALGEGQGQPQLDDSTKDILTRLLARFDGISSHQAFTLRGPPGAGKSTLLHHHLQRSAHRMLQALEDLSGARGNKANAARRDLLLPADACELPVYLRLGDVPLGLGGSGNTPTARLAFWQWVLETLEQQGAPEPLLQLLQGRGEWAALGLRPRLLLDGLNDLQVSTPQYRPTRAAMVLEAVHQHLGRPLPAKADAPPPARPDGVPPPLPLLVASRTAPRIDACAVVLLQLDVLPWRPDDVGAYLVRRLGRDAGARRLAELMQVPHALKLCGTPMHLALQCDLWQQGFSVPVEDRDTLYAAWLWMLLHRALFPPDGSRPADCWADPQPDNPTDPAHPDQPGYAQQVLLTDDDRDAIQHSRTYGAVRLRQLPMQGQLLRTLVAQAARQWRDHADGGVPGAERTVAPVPWDDLDSLDADRQPRPLVAANLPPPLRQRFAQACRALGIVQVDRAAPNNWRFSDQSWYQYLASIKLPPNGPALPPRKQTLPDRQWSELRIAGVNYRLMPGNSGPSLAPSPQKGAPQFLPGSTLVADAEGRVCACLKEGRLRITWLNRYSAKKFEHWPTATIPADLKLLGVTMCGERGIEIVTSGQHGLVFIRAEYPGNSPGSMEISIEDSSGPSRAAIFHRTSHFGATVISVHAETGRLTSGEVAFDLESIEFLDAGVTDSGLVYAAIGRQGKERYLALVWPEADKPQQAIKLHCGVPKGLVVVRGGAANDYVLVQANGRLFRLSELTEKEAHAPV